MTATKKSESMITVKATINAPVSKVWEFWTGPEHITKWNQASEDWHSPKAENDLKVGGKFKTTMAAKDGSMSFDFEGTYSVVDHHKAIAYDMPDGRHVSVEFIAEGQSTRVIESFDPENSNPLEMQQNGWQAILDSFKRYTEAN